MPREKVKPQPFRPARLPVVILITQDKGGEGKSLLAQALAECARFHRQRTGIVEVDTAGNSLQVLGSDVVGVKIDAKLARRDPGAALRALTPLYTTIARTCGEKGITIVEFGANEASRGAMWSGMIDLQEELQALNAEVLILTPFTRQAEAMRRGAASASAFLEVLPEARLVLVENERDGCVGELHAKSDAFKVHREIITPLAAKAKTLRMPMIEAGSWGEFEAAGVRLVDAVTMPIDKVMQLTNRLLPEAKILRSDVAAWCGTMFAEFEKIIDFGGANHG